MPKLPPRKQAIIEVAADLFARSGFDATSLQDIADAAGIRKASLYTHVASKDEFLQLIFDDYIDRMLEEAKRIYASDVPAREKLRALVGGVFASIEQYRAHVVVFSEEMRYVETDAFKAIRQKRDGYERIFIATLEEGMEAGEFRCVDPKIVTFLVVGILQWAFRWYDSSGPLGVDEITDIAVDFICQGLDQRPA